MPQKLIKLSFALTLCFFTFPLHSWGLLQGRVKSAHGDETKQYVEGLYRLYDPFYAGPLLAPSAHTVVKGYFNVQPYFFWQKTYGLYDGGGRRVRTRNSLQFQFLSVFQYGITEFMDINAAVQSFLNRRQDQHYFGYGDTSLTLGFQMLEGIIGTPLPSCSFVTGVVFPTGKHERLAERRIGTDSTGAGAYGVSFSLNFQKEFLRIIPKGPDQDPDNYHPIRFRWSFAYTLNSRARVKGFNAYGGNELTHGIVRVGNNFTTIFAWEFSMTKNWVFATDWQYSVTSPSKFSGNTGGAEVGTPDSQSFSVAPALQYNINEKMGVLGGAWFSLAGRNSGSFVSGIISFTVLF